jgi:hypothetical protein
LAAVRPHGKRQFSVFGFARGNDFFGQRRHHDRKISRLDYRRKAAFGDARELIRSGPVPDRAPTHAFDGIRQRVRRKKIGNTFTVPTSFERHLAPATKANFGRVRGRSAMRPFNSRVIKMRSVKTAIFPQKSSATLLEEAGECFDVAKVQHDAADVGQKNAVEQHKNAEQQHKNAEQQHKNAEQQHENAEQQIENAEQQHDNADQQSDDANRLSVNADKLAVLGRKLTDQAVVAKADEDTAAGRGVHPA